MSKVNDYCICTHLSSSTYMGAPFCPLDFVYAFVVECVSILIQHTDVSPPFLLKQRAHIVHIL